MSGNAVSEMHSAEAFGSSPRVSAFIPASQQKELQR